MRFEFGLLEDGVHGNGRASLGADRIHSPFLSVHQNHHTDNPDTCFSALVNGFDGRSSGGHNVVYNDDVLPGTSLDALHQAVLLGALANGERVHVPPNRLAVERGRTGDRISSKG
jgi:hypothetical protein